MKLKVKEMNISTGGIRVVVLNSLDASKYDIHTLDRLHLKYKHHIETVVVDITNNPKSVPAGSIGLFDEVWNSLNITEKDYVKIKLAPKPKSLEYIRKKLDGKKLKYDETRQIVNDIVNNRLSDIEMTYFVSAGYANPFTIDETVSLTRSMTEEGQILSFGKSPVVDKHCIGGIPGNRTTMICVPILAAAGLTIPKTSSRAITSPAGTADTLEVLGNVCLSLRKMKEVVKKTNGCMVWGGSLNLSPADDKIIQVEKALSLDPETQLIASIVSKKLSVSSTDILIDIPYGRGAKVEKLVNAKKLQKSFTEISRKLGVNIKAIITNGENPIGNGIGPSLEARDVLWLLRNDPRQPYDLREKSIKLAGIMLEMGKKASTGRGNKLAKKILDSGDARKKFEEIINAQGAKVLDPDLIQLAKNKYIVKSGKTGIITRIDNKGIAKIARIAGAPLTHCCGVYLLRHAGDKVKKGEPLFEIYSNHSDRMRYAKEFERTNVIYHIH
jgi:putative thymidine phosphorylase